MGNRACIRSDRSRGPSTGDVSPHLLKMIYIFLRFLQSHDFYNSADTSMPKHTGAEPLPRNQLEYFKGMCPSGVHALGSDTKLQAVFYNFGLGSVETARMSQFTLWNPCRPPTVLITKSGPSSLSVLRKLVNTLSP